MNLYVLRHASAGTRRANPALDVRRPLDKSGKRDCLLLGNTLSSMNVSFDLIVSSPLKRSLQTASLVGTETGYEQKILLSDALAPQATFAQFQKMLAECSGYDSLLVVGHSPNLVQFLGLLLQPAATAQDCERRPAAVRLRKGAIARLSLDRGAAMLQWMLDPRVVGKLYASSTSKSRRKTSRK
ncbi:SixA phosphatase family protein [Terriglobus sp.]|uniref:SixA phosphatase family protein n=1 Tax=Terriglobus sp. TaxID=1889013 RepID=UPI003B003719